MYLQHSEVKEIYQHQGTFAMKNQTYAFQQNDKNMPTYSDKTSAQSIHSITQNEGKNTKA